MHYAVQPYTLRVRRKQEVLFRSEGKWLHPLLDLEEALPKEGWEPAELELEDKIVGKAAAFLIVRMGIRQVYAHLLSELAAGVFEMYGVSYGWGERVPRISCKTEEFLATIEDPEEAALLIRRRAGRCKDIPLIVESLYVSRGSQPVLQNLTFAAARGDRVVIRGPNGAGKSTFLRAILGLVPKEKGTILIRGKESSPSNPAWIGYLAQAGGEVDLNITVEEAVEIGTVRFTDSPQRRRNRILQALSLTGMESNRTRLLRTLSGGERRRTELARLFAQEPDILLLDEPTTNLDPEAKQQVLDLLQRYAVDKKVTIVMVTHEEAHFHLPGFRYRVLRNGRLYPGEGGIEAALSIASLSSPEG
ncbi:MAG: DUF1893 domain-containing protein [Spirochaetales bacterium]